MNSASDGDKAKILELEKICLSLFLEQKPVRNEPFATTDDKIWGDGDFPFSEKLEMSTSLLSDIQHDISEKKRAHTDKVDTIELSIEEINRRLEDLEKDVFTFKRDVVIKGNDNEATGNGGSDRVLRYFQTRILGLESTVGRLKMHHLDYKRRLHKLLLQSRQRDTAGSSIHFLDFHQLQIDTKRQIKRLQQQTNELGRIKVIVSKHLNDLSVVRKTIDQINNDIVSIDKATELREKHISKLDFDIKEMIKTNERSARFIPEANNNNGNGEEKNVPVMDLINRQNELYALRKELSLWKRKLDISMNG